MGLFSKFKDYNGELDEVLDSKVFSSNVKNLLLSMMFKLEDSYKDFYTIKRYVRKKEDFLNEIIEVIRLYCDNIKLVDPDSDEAAILSKHKLPALTNEDERSILAYSTEIALLYAISDISPKYFYINEDFLLKDVFQNILVDGYNLNNVEILQNFNGWSWDIRYEDFFNYTDNIIYQNLLMILGEKFLYEWRTYGSTRRDFLAEAKGFVKIYTGNEDFFKYLYKVLYLASSRKERRKIDIDLSEKFKTLKLMSNKTKYLTDIKQEKVKLEKKVRKIDNVISNREKLVNEYKKYNDKLPKGKKLKKVSTYKKLLVQEKDRCASRIREIEYVLIPGNFSMKKKMLKETIDLYRYDDSIKNAIIELQREFLKFMDKKLAKMDTRDEIVDILFEIRYYSKIEIFKGISTYDVDILADSIDKIEKKAITKLCKLGAMKIISMNINLNFEIIKYSLDTKIIDLESIKLYFDSDEHGLIIKVFDKDSFEKQGRKKIRLSKDTLEVSQRRKINLFN